MRIEWLPEVEAALSAQLDWIAERDPGAAIDVGDAILRAVDRLADHPALGRPGRVPGTREPPVGTPYIVVYRIEEAAAVILRVLHGAQRWPAP